MADFLTNAAIRLYCDNRDHIRLNPMPSVLVAEPTVSFDDAERALAEVRELVAFCVREIHYFDRKRSGSERPGIEALKAKRPDLESEFLGLICKYSSWGIAKGA